MSWMSLRKTLKCLLIGSPLLEKLTLVSLPCPLDCVLKCVLGPHLNPHFIDSIRVWLHVAARVAVGRCIGLLHRVCNLRFTSGRRGGAKQTHRVRHSPETFFCHILAQRLASGSQLAAQKCHVFGETGDFRWFVKDHDEAKRNGAVE
ncbi:unnamed protein product [Pleuronectes platessa]|uniref:Uncharacterized protein n=1 Tax=Pleuronectes platessa TaxID=8262 RepID=A0A9N7Z0J1_PLEPL|nr:unnamed protein product [Pleuronectes platessa]